MQSKSLLIAIAAFAVTATGVHAYEGANIFSRAGLSEDQVSALEEARELKENGDFDAARDLLVEAGIDEDVLKSIHKAAKEARSEMREALMGGDYEAFKEAVEGTPLADIITTETDFEQFKEAHELRHEGDFDAASEIFEELGLPEKGEGGHKSEHKKRGNEILSQLDEGQQEAFQVARQANDKATMQAILDEAGIGHHHSQRGR